MIMSRVQHGIELLYRVQTDVDIEDFVIDEVTRLEIGAVRTPREQLLVSESANDLELALFVDPGVLSNLASHDPGERLDETNLSDFLLTVEGVSHFVYVVWHAQNSRPVSALELELQAEVDKYVTCLLTMLSQAGRPPPGLRAKLFEQFELDPHLGDEERERYLVANSNARAYAAVLDERFVARNSFADMLDELRRFYRLGGQDKLAHIALAA